MNQRQLFLEYVAQTSPTPLALPIERAEGVFLYDSEGNPYIDLISGIAVSSLGHSNPKILEAIQTQASKYLHLMVYGELVQGPQVLLAQKLAELLPDSLNNVYFTNSGTEAIEGAMKLAKRLTNRTEIVSCYNAYHGSTQGALSISGSEQFKQNYRPLLPSIRHIHYGSFSDIDKQITTQTACVIIETIQGEAGVRVACTNYFQKLRARCTEVGALLILDEIQVGMGRTGKLWAFEHFGIVPDMIVLGKALGAGLPLGAFISSKENMQTLTINPILGHITTFGGHPLCCAAALAGLELMTDEKYYLQAEEKAALFRKYLIHPKIKEIRSIGLMMAVEFENFAFLKAVIDEALLQGVLTDWFLFCDNSMRIAPPLIIEEAEIKSSCEKILDAINRVSN
jgi:putrescine aminotransferase